MKKIKTAILEWLHRKAEKVHHAHEYLHLGYFAAVAIEAHGMYAMMAGILLVVGVALVLAKMGDL